jgi:RNA polymerase sigma factor (sigma-70 family)
LDKDYKIAKAFAVQILGREELAEEIAQEVLIERWKDFQNERTERNIKFQVIDVIRRYYGRKFKDRPNRRNIEMLDRHGEAELININADNHAKDLWVSEEHNQRDERMDFGFDIGLRTESHKVVLDLYFNGFKQSEIAKILGFQPECVSVMLKKIKKRIEKYYTLHKRLEEFKEDPRRFILKIDWIQL